jgi:hypothetical protein
MKLDKEKIILLTVLIYWAATAADTELGCILDYHGDVFNAAKQTNVTSLTHASCSTFCTGFAYYGIKNSSDCWCGTASSPISFAQHQTDCSYTCSGNSTQAGGGLNRLTALKKEPTLVGTCTSGVNNHIYNISDPNLRFKIASQSGLHYSNDMICTITVAASAGYTPYIQFTSLFSTHSDQDILNLYEQDHLTRIANFLPLYGTKSFDSRYGASATYFPFNSNTMIIDFRTDASGESTGFTAEIFIIPVYV